MKKTALTNAIGAVNHFRIWSYGRTVLGHLASKSNSRRKASWGGVIKSEAAMQFAQDFVRQVPHEKVPFSGPVRLWTTVYYADERRDLDVSLLQDCIQARGIIKNDRQIKEIHAFRKVDKKRPRVEFRLEQLVDYVAD